jgi:hypothetical protein
MIQELPPFPEGRPRCFRSTVHGTCFAGRDRWLDVMSEGDEVRLVPDPPVQDPPEVWVHLPSGEPVGHLPPEISRWLWPWMRGGGLAKARASSVHGADVPSWRRLVLDVRCG